MPELHPEIQEIHQQAYRDAVASEEKYGWGKWRIKNHDASVSVMIDAQDDERIGLSGRDAEQQFIRLAGAYNNQKKEIKRLREALRLYADKKNWARDNLGRLMIFSIDTNGPYIALSALKEDRDD